MLKYETYFAKTWFLTNVNENNDRTTCFEFR